LPAAGLLLVDGAGLPAAAGLMADCLPAGADWWFVSDFIWGICPLKLEIGQGFGALPFGPIKGQI